LETIFYNVSSFEGRRKHIRGDRGKGESEKGRERERELGKKQIEKIASA
jgi:hypothetical protein